MSTLAILKLHDYLAKYAFGSPVVTVNYVVAMCNYAALAYKCQNAC